MRRVFPQRLDEAREQGAGGTGVFLIQGPCGEKLKIVSSERFRDPEISKGWDHVSISCRKRTPNWREMCFVKDLFWPEDETVIQFHPPKSEYVNNHPYVLHLWQHSSGHATPPSIMVGHKDLGELTANEALSVALGHGMPRR